MKEQYEYATLAGGCFWCLEAVYVELQGIIKSVSGYSGGHQDNPSYEEVCNETTGHAEVVQLTFDPNIISFKEIVEIFFFIHDPTTLNRQGNDVGTQYRSAIYYHNDEQQVVAREFVKFLTAEKAYSNTIVTEIRKLENFFPAETHHQNYYARNPFQGYCSFVITPKVSKFRQKYLSKLKNNTS